MSSDMGVRPQAGPSLARSLSFFRRPEPWIFLPLFLAYIQTFVFLLDHGVSWQLPEVVIWKIHASKWGFPLWPSDLLRAFHWQIFEFSPRVTRPLSNVMELFDLPLRMWLWNFFPVP